MISTPIADMITEMLKNCIPLEMIVSAVRSMERAVSTRLGVDETAEKRRAWDRDYRRRKREHPPDQPDIHPKPPEVGDIALTSLSEVKKHSGVVIKKERKERGHKLPPDWIPKQKHYDEGEKLGMNRTVVLDRAVSMREWCDANANRSITTKANWDSAFMGTWIKGTRNGHANSTARTYQASGSPPTRDATVIAGMAGALERRRAARATDQPADQDIREKRGAGAAFGADAERDAAPGDAGPHRQFALLPSANTG